MHVDGFQVDGYEPAVVGTANALPRLPWVLGTDGSPKSVLLGSIPRRGAIQYLPAVVCAGIEDFGH